MMISLFAYKTWKEGLHIMTFTVIGAVGGIYFIISHGKILKPGRMERWSKSDCRARPARSSV